MINKFNPDYLCNDPSCKSRDVIMDMSKEYQDLQAELEDKIERLESELRITKDVLHSTNSMDKKGQTNE